MTEKTEWIPIKEGWRIATEGAVDVSLAQFRNWVRNKKHGIVSGRFGDRIVIRKDTIPIVVVQNE